MGNSDISRPESIRFGALRLFVLAPVGALGGAWSLFQFVRVNRQTVGRYPTVFFIASILYISATTAAGFLLPRLLHGSVLGPFDVPKSYEEAPSPLVVVEPYDLENLTGHWLWTVYRVRWVADRTGPPDVDRPSGWADVVFPADGTIYRAALHRREVREFAEQLAAETGADIALTVAGRGASS